MTTPYNGDDAPTVGAVGSPVAAGYISGKGHWVTPYVPADSDSRDANNTAVGQEGAIDRTVWLVWRFVNGLEGNTSTTQYAGNIWWSGVHRFEGVVVLSELQGNVEISGNPNFTGSPQFTGPAVTIASPPTISKPLTHSGDDGYRALRKKTGFNGTTTINAWKMDVLEVPDLSANTVWTLAHPPNDEVIELTVHWPAQTGTKRLELKDGSTTLFVANSETACRDGSIAKVRLVYSGSAWKVVGFERGRQTLQGPDSDTTINAWEYDLVLVPDLGANRTYTVAEPPASHPPFETEFRWASQVTSKTLTIQTVGGLSTLGSVTAGSNTSNGIATIVVANDAQGSGPSGAASYYIKSQRGPY